MQGGEEANPVLEGAHARRARAIASAAMRGLAGATATTAALVSTRGRMLPTDVEAGVLSSILQGMVHVTFGEIAGGPRDVSMTMRTVQGLALVKAYGVGGDVPLTGQWIGGILGIAVAATAGLVVIGGAMAEYAGRNSGLLLVVCGILAFGLSYIVLIYHSNH